MFQKYFKGFDKDLKCRDFQYSPGETYEEPKASVCECGFHACKDPLDTFNYYQPGKNRYCEVELDDVVEGDPGGDTKVAGKKIRLGAEIGIKGVIQAAVKFIFDKTDVSDIGKVTTGDYAHAVTTGNDAHAATTGDYAHAATTGYRAHAATTGDYAHAVTTGDYAHAATTGDYAHAATTGYRAHAATTGYRAHAVTTGNDAHAVTTGNDAHAATTGNDAHAATTGNDAHAATTGYRAHAEVKGENSVAAALGRCGAVRGGLGSWLIAVDWRFNLKAREWEIQGVVTAKVDGETIKPDVLYTAENGALVEVEQ